MTDTATQSKKKFDITATKYEEPSEVPITDGMMIHPPYLDWDRSRLTFEKPFDISKLVSAPNTYVSSATYNYPPTETTKGGKGPLRIELPYEGDSMCFSPFGITDQLKELTPEQLKMQEAGQEVKREPTGKKIIRVSIPVGDEVCARLRDVVLRDVYEVGMDHLNACGSSDDGNGTLNGTFLKTRERLNDPVGPDNAYEGLQYPVLFQKKDVEVPIANGKTKIVKRANLDLPSSIGLSILSPEDPSKKAPDAKPKRGKGPSVFFLDDKTSIPLKDLEDRGFYHSPEIGVSLFIGAKSKVRFTLFNSMVTNYMTGNTVGRLQAIEGRAKSGMSTGASMRNRTALFSKAVAVDPLMLDETDDVKKKEEEERLAAEEEERLALEALTAAAAKKNTPKTTVVVSSDSEEDKHETEAEPVQKARTTTARGSVRSRVTAGAS